MLWPGCNLKLLSADSSCPSLFRPVKPGLLALALQCVIELLQRGGVETSNRKWYWDRNSFAYVFPFNPIRHCVKQQVPWRSRTATWLLVMLLCGALSSPGKLNMWEHGPEKRCYRELLQRDSIGSFYVQCNHLTSLAR